MKQIPSQCVEDKQIWENPTCEGRLIYPYPEGCVSSLNQSNPIQCVSAQEGVARWWELVNIFNNRVSVYRVLID